MTNDHGFGQIDQPTASSVRGRSGGEPAQSTAGIASRLKNGRIHWTSRYHFGFGTVLPSEE